MKDIGNVVPGAKLRENPNEKLISCWESALRVVRAEIRVEKLRELKAPSNILKNEEKLASSRKKEMPHEAERFLAAACTFEKNLDAHRESLALSPLGTLKNKLYDHYVDEEVLLNGYDEDEEDSDGEEIPPSSIEETIANFFVRLIERAQEEYFVSIIKELYEVIRAIYWEVDSVDFSPVENIRERELEIRNLKGFSSFISQLEDWQHETEAFTTKSEGEDLTKRVIDSIDRNPDELVANLLIVIEEIILDLRTREIPPNPEEPQEIKNAKKNLLRGKNAIN